MTRGFRGRGSAWLLNVEGGDLWNKEGGARLEERQHSIETGGKLQVLRGSKDKNLWYLKKLKLYSVLNILKKNYEQTRQTLV